MSLVHHLTKCVIFVSAFVFLSVPCLSQNQNGNELQLSLQIPYSNGGIPQFRLESYVCIVVSNKSSDTVFLPELAARRDQWPFEFEFKNLETNEVFITRYVDGLSGPISNFTMHSGSKPIRIEKVIGPRALAPNVGLSSYIKLNAPNNLSKSGGWTNFPAPNTQAKYSLRVHVELEATREAIDGEGSKASKLRLSSNPIEVYVQSVRVNTPHTYLKAGKIDRALALLKTNHAWIEQRDEGSNTPLLIAALLDQPAAIEWMIKNGADVNAKNDKNNTALHLASSVKVVNSILAAGKIEFTANHYGETPILRAANMLTRAETDEGRKNWKQIIELLQQNGAEHDLHSAICANNLPQVKAIYGNPNEFGPMRSSQSPLGLAASLGHLEICKYLVDECGESVNQEDGKTEVPIIFVSLKYPKIIRFLIDKQVDINARAQWHAQAFLHTNELRLDPTALLYAAEVGVPESISHLLDAGADLTEKAEFHFWMKEGKKNALEIAAYYGKFDNLVALLSHESFKELENVSKQNMLDRCLAEIASDERVQPATDRVKLIELLLAHGANPNVENEKGLTVLQLISAWISPYDRAKPEPVRQA